MRAKGLGGRAGGCLWYSGGLAWLPWRSPGYVTDFLGARRTDDLTGGSWAQTPPSTGDRKSPVAEQREGRRKYIYIFSQYYNHKDMYLFKWLWWHHIPTLFSNQMYSDKITSCCTVRTCFSWNCFFFFNIVIYGSKTKWLFLWLFADFSPYYYSVS